MSIEDTNDINDNTNQVLSSFQSDFNTMSNEIKRLSEINQQTVDEMKKISQKYEQIVGEMNSRLKEQVSINNELKSGIISAKATIGDLNKKIQARDETIAEKTSQIQANEAIINEKVKQIKYLTGEGGYAFKGELFSGIFDGLSKKHGKNLVDSGYLFITASSIYGSTYIPQNVLKNDESCWVSKDIPNSWIQFELTQTMVSLTSYSINIRGTPLKSWKVEGSNNGSNFDIIDNKPDSPDFQNIGNGNFNQPSSQKNYQVNRSNKYYKIIRFTSLGKNWSNNDHFQFYRIELFGNVKQD